VPIVPVAFIGSYSVLPKGAFFVHPGTITIKIGDPVVIAGKSSKDKQGLALVIHDQVAELMGHTR
jgi:1-acyl-sn-glycerol-3-phosphate acyltransferase